jgi:hypothetical protein
VAEGLIKINDCDLNSELLSLDKLIAKIDVDVRFNLTRFFINFRYSCL